MVWYYEEDGVQVGPLTETEFEEKVMSGRIKQQTMVWNDGMTQWQPYSTLIVPAAVVSKKFCSQCGRSFPENEMLRYENFLVCAGCKPVFFQSLKEGVQPVGVGVWRDLSRLVMTKDAQLPDRCTVCNAPAHGLRLKRNLYWHPPAWYLLICVGILVYAIAALIVRKRATIEIGLCRKHLEKRKRDKAITWGLIGVMILVTILSIAKYPALFLLAAAIFVGALIYAILTLQPVTPAKITDRFVWLKGVNQDYLNMLPESPPLN